MEGKLTKQVFFEVDLNWLTGKKGILSARDASGILQVAMPPQFGGEGKPWTPEHFFLGAISSCFMTTFLSFADKMKFNISGLTCNAIGEIELVEGKYKFTHINLYPVIYIADESLKEKASLAIEKTHKYCLISNSVNATLYYHSQVLVEPERMFVID